MNDNENTSLRDNALLQLKPDISVIICTKDRCELLQRTVELLGKQHLPAGRSFEIIVVDNNSTDATAQIIKHLQRNIPAPLSYVMERKIGLSHARNAGLEKAGGEIIVFTDDDMIFGENWLQEISMIFSMDPRPACVTGPVEIHKDSHPALRSATSKGRKRFRHPTEPWDVGRGNNMSFDRRYLEKVGPFDARLGAGTPAGSGEDTDMFYRVLKAGGEIVFEPDLSIYHDHGRHDPEAIKRICKSYAVGGTAFLIKHIAHLDVFALKLLYWKFLSFRMGLKRAGDDPLYSPPRKAIQQIYIQGYYQGIRRGIINLFKRA
jgi:glycosyltransferase involved in cell wall biosynthesis